MSEAERLLRTPLTGTITAEEATVIADYFGIDPEGFLRYLHLDHPRPWK